MLKRLLPILLVVFPLSAANGPAAPPDVANPPVDAERSADGLVTKVLAPGTGTVHPTADDLVTIRYTVWKADGTLVQHVPAGQSLGIAVTKMIPGWAAAVRKMVVGETRRAWVSPSLNGGKTDDALVFDTELLSIIEKPKVPADVAAPPADAKKTASGLVYKVLVPGKGDRHPSRGSTVVVHYSGWTPEGRMFDSSVLRGKPAEFAVTEVVKGWTEGLQLMQVGEKTRFWIPSRLAYGDNPGGGRPGGALVFDIELIAIK